MPVEPIELLKLIGGIFIIIIPGYLWSFIFSKDLKHLERVAFGFMLGIIALTCGTFGLEIVFGMVITQTLVFLLFAAYVIPVLVLYLLSIIRFGFPRRHGLNDSEITKKKICKGILFKNKKIVLLLAILAFSVFMTLLPHWSDNYFLPFHVDEWIHWSYARAVIESGSTSFVNPYTGSGIIQSLEIGFHLMTSCIYWLTTSTFLTIFVFMPSIIAIFTSLMAFNIGERSERKFGLEAAFLVAFIPTTCRYLGPSFYAPVATGLLIMTFILWLGQLRKLQASLFIPLVILFMFLIHPPSALAGLLAVLIYSLFLLFEKQYKLAVITGGASLIPVIIILLLSTRWEYSLDIVLDALFGQQYGLDLHLPKIWTSFEHLGVITWILFVIGVYFCFSNGKAIKRTMGLSSIAIIVIVGVYDKLGYGMPIFYERSFLYLYLLVAIIAGVGLAELRKHVGYLKEKLEAKKIKHIPKNIESIVPLAVCILLLVTAVPAHLEIPYYQLINENDYETFVWIEENIDDFRDENHSYDRGAVNPFYASPFSAVTGLYMVSSSMHPIHGYGLHTEMEKFLNEKCVDTGFMDQHKISVVYTTSCNNSNLTMIYPNVYLYPGLYD